MLSMLKEALEWLNRAKQAREVAGQLNMVIEEAAGVEGFSIIRVEVDR